MFSSTKKNAQNQVSWLPIIIACTSEILWSEGNYISVVEKQTMPWEEWCIHGVKWSEIEDPQNGSPIDNTSSLGTTSFTQLALKMFSNANIGFIRGYQCPFRSVRRIQLKFSSASHSKADYQMNLDLTLIQTNFEGYKFLTCYAEPYITLDFYITPFQLDLWLVLGTTIGIIIALTTLCQRFFSLLEQKRFSAWMYILASLFDESGFIPTRIERHTFFRISLGIWSIMSVILTNGYNGIMISGLNAPRRLFHPVSFNELTCKHMFKMVLKYWNADDRNLSGSNRKERHNVLKIWTFEFMAFHIELWRLTSLLPVSPVFAEQIYVNLTQENNACYRLLSGFEPASQERVLPEFLAVLQNLVDTYLQTPNNLAVLKYLSLFSSKHSFYPKGFSYLSKNLTFSSLQRNTESEVVQCGKTVFIGKSSEIKLEYEFLTKQYPDIKFSVSTQKILSYPTGMLFQHVWRSPVATSFKRLNEAGI